MTARTDGMIWSAELPVAYLHGVRDAARLEIRIERKSRIVPYQTITHQQVDTVDHFSMSMSSRYAAGQCDQVLDPRDPMVGRLTINPASALMLRRIWRRWHLNDMKAGCRHQRHIARKWSKAAKLPSSTRRDNWSRARGHFFKLECDATGYKFGSAWLVEPLPTDRLIRRLTSILAECPGAVIRDYRNLPASSYAYARTS
jgi:hypothetical protein